MVIHTGSHSRHYRDTKHKNKKRKRFIFLDDFPQNEKFIISHYSIPPDDNNCRLHAEWWSASAEITQARSQVFMIQVRDKDSYSF
jgi:hypothetical protein